ncbi:MAG: extracellular solute-binding protein [Agitococcus sp.]|nr:extracellular solute-binding protein [Agitococcus sp.]
MLIQPDFFKRLTTAIAVVSTFALATPTWAAHAVAQFGEPKYPANFQHFDYVNVNAPQGGRINLSVISQSSSFDKFNPFTLKGKLAPGVLDLVFETLTVNGFDEPNTQYGLIADDIRVAPDFSGVSFHINPKARFSNGDFVTAKDVKYSFDTLTSKKASPKFKAYFAEIAQLTIVDPQTVRFDFKRKGRDLSFVAGSLPIFSPKWGLKSDGSTTPFDQLKLQKPIGTGAYQIEKAVEGQDVVYKQRADYWAKQQPVRKGFYNFERVAYKLYKDRDTQVAAVRAGEFDFLSEIQMRYWCCQYIGKRFDTGELVKEEFAHKNIPGMVGWVVNQRKERFNDPRIRLAMNYTLDFEWINQKILDNEFKRPQTFFANSALAATGVPSAAELKLLEPYRKDLDPAVFGPMFQQPSTNPPSSLRANLLKALDLFAQAGWHNKDGVLRNVKGEPFELELSGTRQGSSPHTETVNRNLSKVGIVIKKKMSDAATTRRRMNDFDFDYTTLNLRDSRMPAIELWRAFNSKDADVKGSENIAGVKSAAVDGLLKKMMEANTQEEYETAAHAVDRVLINGHYVIPFRYLTDHYFIYNHRLQRPANLPSYYGAYEWVLGTWWDKTIPTKTAQR